MALLTFQSNLKFAPGTERMAVTACCQYAMKFEGLGLADHAYQVPLNSCPSLMTELPSPAPTKRVASVTK